MRGGAYRLTPVRQINIPETPKLIIITINIKAPPASRRAVWLRAPTGKLRQAAACVPEAGTQ